MLQPIYKGSSKHKNRPKNEQKGTLCPEWTHRTSERGLETDVLNHDWQATPVAGLFEGAIHRNGRRYATGRGIAFEARMTGDGTWHGFPVPWESVPADIAQRWRTDGLITKHDVRKFFHFEKDDIYWPLKTDRA